MGNPNTIFLLAYSLKYLKQVAGFNIGNIQIIDIPNLFLDVRYLYLIQPCKIKEAGFICNQILSRVEIEYSLHKVFGDLT